MRELDTIEPQNRGDPSQRIGRGLNVSPLFEPRIPTDTDAGQQRDFFPAQARRSARLLGKAEIERVEARAPAGEKAAKLSPLFCRWSSWHSGLFWGVARSASDWPANLVLTHVQVHVAITGFIALSGLRKDDRIRAMACSTWDAGDVGLLGPNVSCARGARFSNPGTAYRDE